MTRFRTPSGSALWASLLYWRRYESRKAAFNALRFRLGPYLPQDLDDAYEGLATTMRWSGLHHLFCRLSLPAPTSIPPELVSQVNVRDSWGWTPLFYAMLVGPEAMHPLLCVGANPKIKSFLLVWTARAGADTAVSALVRAGAYINAPEPGGRTALHWAAFSNLALSINGFAVALELVRHAGHLLDWDVRNSNGYVPLDWAQSRALDNPDDGDTKRILELYRTHRLPDGAQYLPTPRIIDAADEAVQDDISGLPPTSLVRAGLRGDIDAIGDLISQRAMVNERDSDGRTLLHLVALGKVPNGYRVALELVRHGGWGVDWDASAGVNRREYRSKGQEDVEWDGEGVGCTPLEIAGLRLKHESDRLTDKERTELENVRDLLKARRLPPDEAYLWPCMDPDFYPLRIPGAWRD